MNIEEIKEFKNTVESVPDEEPDRHDGSYNLVRTAVDLYAGMLKEQGNLDNVGQRDLMVFFHLVVGTWVTKIQTKIRAVNNSNLGLPEKGKLERLLEDTWDNAENSLYSNREGGNTSVGLFGSGTRKINATDKDSRELILMLIKIKPMTDRQEIYSVVADFLEHCTLGNIIATFSSILHCLKPEIFPVINNVTKKFFADMLGCSKARIEDLRRYITNCKEIWAFCEDNGITFKSYRRIDRAIQI